jgi:hypothetical protein
LQVLDQGSLKYIIHDENDIGPIMDLNLIRELPSVLDDPAMMSYFALLNNCQAHAAAFRSLQVQKLPNELDFPPIAQFYKTKAASITRDAPRRVAFVFADFPSGNQIENFYLGQYDTATGFFPIVNRFGAQVTVKYDNVIAPRSIPGCIGGPAQPVIGRMPRSQRVYPPAYNLSFPPLSFTRV